VLKPILAAACLGAASLAAPQSHAQSHSGLSGQQITELVAGATIEVDTPVGTTMPLRYTRDGKVTGDAGGLGWYMGAATDSGRWWVVADKLCHRWARWFNSEPQCMRLTRQGRIFHWRTDEGSNGTARITVPATMQASAAPHLKPGRLLRFALPPAAEAPPANAYAPAAAAPSPAEVEPQQAATEPPAPAAAPLQSPAAQATPAPAAAPSLVVPPAAAAPAPASPANSAWPLQQAEPQPHAKPAQQALFKVANVRRDDVLNVRSGPSADHDIVGELPPGSRGIAIVSECRSRWCPVQHHATTGWVNSTYLAPEVMQVALHVPADLQPGALRDSPEAPRACLTQAARSLLDRIEQKFGRVEVVSTCRPGAFIAGSGRPSRHASGNAVDFKAGARKAAILEWLMANHRSGGIMTYPAMDHIHVDIGPRFVSIAGGAHWSSWSRRARD
jgi:hypothetical protein